MTAAGTMMIPLLLSLVVVFLQSSLLVSGWVSPNMAPVQSRARRSRGKKPSSASAVVRSAAAASLAIDDATAAAAATSLTESLASLEQTPAVIVFDLDNTLWTPELYQIRQKNTPKATRDIHLFPDALHVLRHLMDNDMFADTKLAIASRTNKRAWAEQLLQDFEIEQGLQLGDVFQHVEIYTGSKKKHFAAIREAVGCEYGEMLFFDDDARLNLGEVSQLGVLCCHTPRGITVPHFEQSLQQYDKLRAGHVSAHWMGMVLDAGNLKLPQEEQVSVPVGAVQGRVKFYSGQKKFGFIVDVASGEEYFIHESKVPSGVRIETGDSVVFEAGVDSTGRNFAVVVSLGDDKSGATSDDTISMPCFTMSQPFAALLLNGIKTVETRNNPMFQDVEPGTKVLLHCGKRDWPDQESYRAILKEDGYSEAEIDEASSLPQGFSKGAVIGCLTVGKTWRASDQERQDKGLQRRVLAPYDAVGKMCTEVVDAEWLDRPVKTSGKPGVYNKMVPKDCLQ